MGSDTLWPDGARFAFTIFDDTDLATVANVGPVYDFLHDLGLRTTKSVWPLAGSRTPKVGGLTCADPEYRTFTLLLQERGFEIGFHNATYHTSDRAQTLLGLDYFRELYGHDPRSMANHVGCAEAIYWGDARLSGAHRHIYNLLTRHRRKGAFRGHVEGDPLFWGDLCRERVTYVRNFQFADLDTLGCCPEMPYRDPERPYVNAWFAASEGAEVNAFTRCIGEAAQDRLEASGGACIMYTHLACGFFADGALEPRFERLMRRLAAKGGWFVPVTTLLDHIAARRGISVLNPPARRRLERRWLASKLRTGPS